MQKTLKIHHGISKGRKLHPQMTDLISVSYEITLRCCANSVNYVYNTLPLTECGEFKSHRDAVWNRLFGLNCDFSVKSITHLNNMDTHPPETEAFKVETADLEHNYHNIHEARRVNVFIMSKRMAFCTFSFRQ